MMFRLLLLVSAVACYASAFVSPFHNTCKHSLVTRQALWRHFVPRSQEFVWDETCQVIQSAVKQGVLASCLALTLTVPTASLAVSGGGLDYANLDITGQDFSNNNYKGKDFTQVIAKGTKFAKSNLQGCRFYKAYLVNADFSDADLRGASLEDTSMDGASLKNTDARGAYFGQSLLDVGTLENADFTDAQIPIKTLPLVCGRSDVKGTNPTTGADTRESLMCP